MQHIYITYYKDNQFYWTHSGTHIDCFKIITVQPLDVYTVKFLWIDITYYVDTCTCVEKWAQTNDAEDESDSKGSSHLLGDAPVPLLVLLQGVDPIIPIFIGEAKV